MKINLKSYGLTDEQISEMKSYGLTDEEIVDIVKINEFENNNPEYDAIKLFNY